MPLDRKKTLALADGLVAEGQVLKAVHEYRKLLKESPGEMALMNRIGDLCLQLEHFDDAADIFKLLALNLHRDKEERKAVALLKKVMRFRPGDLEAAHQLVELLMGLDSPKEAAQVHFQVARHFDALGDSARSLLESALGVAADPTNIEQRLALAQRYAQEGQRERAAGLFLEAAETLALQHRFEEAALVLERAGHQADGPRLILTKAKLQSLSGHPEAAVLTLAQALERHPGNPVLLETLAETELQAGHPLEALMHLRSLRHPGETILPICESALRELVATGSGRHALRAFRPLAHALCKRGAGPAVIATLDAAFEQWHHVTLWILRAEVALECDQKAPALEALRQAYTLSMDRPSGALRDVLHRWIEGLEGRRRTIGQIITEQAGQATQVMPLLTRGRLDPHTRLQLDQMEREAHIQAKLGNPKGALSLFQRIIGMDPTRLSAIQALIGLQIRAGNLPKAQLQCTHSAEVLARHGRRQEAKQLLDLLEQHSPGSTETPRRSLGL